MLGKDESEKLVVTDFADGKRARGRQREIFLTYLGKMKQKLPMELLQMAQNRTVWSKLCTYQSMFTNKILNDDNEPDEASRHCQLTLMSF